MTIYGTYQEVDPLDPGEEITIRVSVNITDFDAFVHAGPDANVFVTEVDDEDNVHTYCIAKSKLTFSLNED